MSIVILGIIQIITLVLVIYLVGRVTTMDRRLKAVEVEVKRINDHLNRNFEKINDNFNSHEYRLSSLEKKVS